MRSRWHTTTAVAIPSNVPAEVLRAYIQSCIPVFDENPSITGFEETIPDLDVIAGDPFFDPSNHNVRAFEVRETIYLAPGLTKNLKWPTIFQISSDGVRLRSTVSTGMICWTGWTVRRRTEGLSPASDSTSSTATCVAEEWEVHGELTIEGNRLVMPFVTQRSDHVMQVMCRALVDGGARAYFKGRSGMQ